MDGGRYRAPEKRRKRRCFIVSVIVFLAVVIVVAVVLARTLGHDHEGFKETFIRRCETFKGYNCENIFAAFEQAYVGRNHCHVPVEAYDPFIAAAPITPPCNQMMFWSKTKDTVHDFTERGCFFTIEDTLLGAVADGLTWCGREGSKETFTTGCTTWSDGETRCDNNPVRSFWSRASAAFAEIACGNVSVMLNGSISTPFNPNSTFASIEVKHFNPKKMRLLNVVLVTQQNSVSNCTNASLKELQKELAEGIAYSCKEVSEAQIQQCSSRPQPLCDACW